MASALSARETSESMPPLQRSESRHISERRCRSKPSAREHSDCTGSLRIGDDVKVFSRSANAWVMGEVADLLESDYIRVEYESCRQWCGKELHLHSEHLQPLADCRSQNLSAEGAEQQLKDRTGEGKGGSGESEQRAEESGSPLEFWMPLQSEPIEVEGCPVPGVPYTMQKCTWPGLEAGKHFSAPAPPQDGKNFVSQIEVVEAGVLGVKQDKKRMFQLSGSDVFVDPSVIINLQNFIQLKRDGSVSFVRGPNSAWNLPWEIYKSIRVPGSQATLAESWQFPASVRKQIKSVGDAAFFQYVFENGDAANVVHCPGWNFNANDTRKGHCTAVGAEYDDAVVLLSGCYKKILAVTAGACRAHSLSLNNLYFAPLSGGHLHQNTSLQADFPAITCHALALAFNELDDQDKFAIKDLKFNLCIWATDEQSVYREVLARFLEK